MNFSGKWISILLLISVLPAGIFADHLPGKVDSLKQAFELAESDSAKYSLSIELAREFFGIDSEQGLTYAIFSFELAKRMAKKEDFSGLHNNKGIFLYSLGRYQEAQYEFENALQSAQFIQDEEERARITGSIFGHLGLSYGEQEKFDLEQSYYLKGFRLAEERGLLKSKLIFSNNLAKSYMDQQDYSQARKYIMIGLELAEGHDFPEYEALPYLNMGIIHMIAGQQDSAMKYIRTGLSKSEENGGVHKKTTALLQLSEYLLESGMLNESLSYALEAEAGVSNHKDQLLEVQARLNLARVYRSMGQLDEAEKWANSCLANLRITGPERSISVYEELEKIALAKDDYPCALDMRSTIGTLKDSLLKIGARKFIENAENISKVNRLTIDNLKKEKELQDQLLKRNNLIIFFAGLAVVLALIALVFLFRNLQQRKFINQTLEEKVKTRTAELTKLNSELEEANTEMKYFNRIANHDLRTPVANVKSLVELFEGKEALSEENKEYLHLIDQSADKVLKILRDMSGLYTINQESLMLEEFSLGDLGKELVLSLQELLAEKGGTVIFPEDRIIHSYRAPIFMSLKNLIENGIKYNESSHPRVEVAYQYEEGKHLITVSDNGIGIAKEEYELIFDIFRRSEKTKQYDGRGLGLSISQKMIERIGGLLNLKSSEEGIGSQFVITLFDDFQKK